MPIKTENKVRYPRNWSDISRGIIHDRAGNKCEVCGAVNHSWVNKHTRQICLQDEDNSVRIVLTTAHLDHQPENCSHDNLKAMCQKCHNRYDVKHRASTRSNTYAINNYSLF